MSQTLTINPAHLSVAEWATIRSFIDAAGAAGEVVDFSTRVETLTPAQVAERLGMSRSTVLRRIASGELRATKVGTHHRIPLTDFEQFSHELMRQMAQVDAHAIDAELADV
ncbi:MAG: helix-turn-helix domain-containing protein [Micrococcales bacterium]|nr:helix-turn-helix domain-containing protein [Micrococcales bacterium]